MGLMMPDCSEAGMTGEVQELGVRDRGREPEEGGTPKPMVPEFRGGAVTALGCVYSLVRNS